MLLATTPMPRAVGEHVPVRVGTLERELLQEHLEHGPARLLGDALHAAEARSDQAVEEALAGVAVHGAQLSLRSRALGVVERLAHHALERGVHVRLHVHYSVAVAVAVSRSGSERSRVMIVSNRVGW